MHIRRSSLKAPSKRPAKPPRLHRAKGRTSLHVDLGAEAARALLFVLAENPELSRLDIVEILLCRERRWRELGYVRGLKHLRRSGQYRLWREEGRGLYSGCYGRPRLWRIWHKRAVLLTKEAERSSVACVTETNVLTRMLRENLDPAARVTLDFTNMKALPRLTVTRAEAQDAQVESWRHRRAG